MPCRLLLIVNPTQDNVLKVRELHHREPLADLREILVFWEALQELVKRDLKARYKRSVLGFAWSMLNPVLMVGVTSFVFGSLFHSTIRNFSTYMLSAYILWWFFAQATSSAMNSVRAGAALSRKIYLPPALFPLAAVNAAAVNLLLCLLPLFLLVAVTEGSFTWPLLFVPFALALVVLFTYGVALILAATSVFFHDTVHLYQTLLMAWMYLTPIFYPIEILPQGWSFVVHLNPFFHLVQIFRDPIYAGTWPDPVNVVAAAVYAIGAAALGWWYFGRSRSAFASYL